MFAYGKLQAVSCDPKAEPGLQEWCTKRVQHLCVLAGVLLTNNKNHAGNKSQEKLIESHVRFMAEANRHRTMIKVASNISFIDHPYIRSNIKSESHQKLRSVEAWSHLDHASESDPISHWILVIRWISDKKSESLGNSRKSIQYDVTKYEPI